MCFVCHCCSKRILMIQYYVHDSWLIILVFMDIVHCLQTFYRFPILSSSGYVHHYDERVWCSLQQLVSNPESLLYIRPPCLCILIIIIIFTCVGHLMRKLSPVSLFLYTHLLYLYLLFPYIPLWIFPHWSLIQKVLSFIPRQTCVKTFCSQSETFTTAKGNVKETSYPSCGSEPALSSSYPPLY
jgi:hypothetical protein